MENYYQLALLEFERRKNNLPQSGGTVKGMAAKTSVFAKYLEWSDENLADLGNDYVSKTPEGSVKVDEIIKVNKSFVEDYISAFKTR